MASVFKRDKSGHVQMESDIEVMQLQAKELLEPPEAGRSQEGLFPRAFGESTLISDFWPPGL